MSKSEPVHMLIVHPPVAPPSLPPPPMARLALQAGVSGLSLEQVDANVDFYTRYLFNPENLRRFLAVIEVKTADGVYRAVDPDTRRALDDLAENRPRWEARISTVDQTLQMCRQERFFRPENCVSVLGDVAALLKLVSLAFYPSQVGWGTFDHPAARDPDGRMAFAQAVSANPFREFAESRLAPKLKRPGLRLLLFWVFSGDQLPAAATMAVFSKMTNPQLPVAAAAPPRLLAGSEPFADTLLTVPDDKLLFRLARLAGGKDAVRPETGPGCRRFPEDACLAPAPVLPIDLRPDAFQPPSPAGLCDAIENGRLKLGTHGAFITVADDLPRYSAGAGKRPAGVLGIRATLQDNCLETDGKSLHGAGVRLIVWQAPKGSLKTLKTILWRMSRAGIWNHLQVFRGARDSLDEALHLFAAANPNIVHSCEPVGPGRQVYGRVRKLPGKPLWQTLNDPVHLLLYLERHGRQKIMRWRVSDARTGVYSLGSRLAYHYVTPDVLPADCLDEICRMVADGGSVDMQRVRYNLERAFLIAYAMEHGVIVGNSSLKNPRADYIETVNRQSGLDLTGYVERGYTSVRPEYRGMGIGARLLAGLTKRAGRRKVFSVISEDNAAARKMAVRNRTRRVAEYDSPRLGKRVGIWIPEWMLD